MHALEHSHTNTNAQIVASSHSVQSMNLKGISNELLY